eukprot:6179109-Pleurochrysis_carterae.AAC.2
MIVKPPHTYTDTAIASPLFLYSLTTYYDYLCCRLSLIGLFEEAVVLQPTCLCGRPGRVYQSIRDWAARRRRDQRVVGNQPSCPPPEATILSVHECAHRGIEGGRVVERTRC